MKIVKKILKRVYTKIEPRLIAQLQPKLQTAIQSDLTTLNQNLQVLHSQIENNNLSSNPATTLGYKGDGHNRVYRSFIGSERALSSIPAKIPLQSTLCQQVYFTLDQYRFWAAAMKERPQFLRKQWEHVYIAHALFERGFLQKGMRGLGFGVGREPLPSLFASFGTEILATDQSLEGAIRAGWASTNQHSIDLSVLNERQICIDAMFNKLVKFGEVDMNNIPSDLNDFDFCWSSCSLEHLGSLKHGMDFVRNSLKVLKSGGIAVHTTEFNLSSNTHTIESKDLSIYRKRDIEELAKELTDEGHYFVPIDWTLGEGLAEIVVDLPPYGRGEPHLRLRIGEYDCTSVGFIIIKR